MEKHTVRIAASKAGSIGLKYCERRTYEVSGRTFADIINAAIDCAYADGLEHVLVTHITKEPSHDPHPIPAS